MEANLKILAKEPLERRFYKEELQVTTIPTFKIINKVVKRKTEGRKKMVLVSYLEHSEKFNQWIPETEYNTFIKLKKKLDL